MNLYPAHIEEKIGFVQIREYLLEGCLTIVGRERVETLQVFTEEDRIREEMGYSSELRGLLEQGNRPPETEFEPTDEAIQYAAIQGSMLSLEQLDNLKIVLQSALDTFYYIQHNREEGPKLFDRFGQIHIDKDLLKELDRCIDERGELKDTASKELQRLRSQVGKFEKAARSKLTQQFGAAKNKGFTPDGSSISIRSGRLVLPVLAEHKKKIKGLVHDMSSTGSTFFIEPEEVLELNNELREYQHLERREVNRILSDLTARVRESEGMDLLTDFLGDIDFIRSKAKLSRRLDACSPVIGNEKTDWVNARHPLLYLSFKEQDKKVIPQNIHLDSENRIILISGPNAGGKSVALKTLGLIQYMAQCGLEVPMEENSELQVFSNIYIDIGDEQSLENDLSTYSSHLINMKYFMEHSDEKTLILIDEFGTGTDPEYGGAIAEAVLTSLIGKKAMGMITTHYGNLKQFAEHRDGVINGAMQFDAKKLEPLYKLEIGRPGSSFAVEIATKIGLDTSTIDMARKIIGEEKVHLDELIATLEKEKLDLENQLNASQELNRQMENNIDRYQDLREQLDVRKKEIIDQAKQEARSMIKQANVQIEKTIREIKESSADKSKTKDSREELKQLDQKISEKSTQVRMSRKKQKETTKVISGEIKVNDRVRIKDQETKATVLAIKGKEAELLIGQLRSTVKLNRLEKIGSGDQSSGKKSVARGIDLSRKMAEFSSDIDIRGKRVEEVLPELERYLDNALMFNASQLRIVHGKGNGVLREVVRNLLKGYKEVKTISDEHADRGGAGVTIVELQ